MDNYYTKQLKKTSSGIGFYVFACFVSMIIVPVVLFSVSMTNGIDIYDNINLYLLQSITSLASMIIPGFFYCRLSNTSLQSLVPFQKISLKKLLLFISLGFGVAFLGDYITELFGLNLSLFGITNKASMEFNSYTPLENFLFILSVAVIPAIAEEFAVRGIVLGKLRQFGDKFAVLVSAIIFGALHGNISQTPFAFILGLVLGFIVIKTNSILPTIIIHFLNNFYSIVITIMKDSKNFTDNDINIVVSLSMLIIVALAIMSAIILSKDKSTFNIEGKEADIIPFRSKMTTSFKSIGMIMTFVLLTLITIGNTNIMNYG